MSKKEAFKNFIKNKPELVDYVKDGSMTWQKFYELYDIYEEDPNIWNKYKRSDRNNPFIGEGMEKITNIVKNVNMNSIKNHINTAQKAIDIVQDFALKKPNNTTNNFSSLNKGPASPRPLNKFFED